MRLSRYSKRNARPQRERRTAERAQQRGSSRVRMIGTPRRFRRIDDPDVVRPQLAGDAGLLGALHQDCRKSGGCSRPRVRAPVLDRLAIHRQRFALLLVERLGETALLTLRGEILVADRLHHLGHFAFELGLRDLAVERSFTISGCLSPNFSLASASCRCSPASSAFCCWMKPLARIAGKVSRPVRFDSIDSSCRCRPSLMIRSVFARVTAAFRSLSFWTTMSCGRRSRPRRSPPDSAAAPARSSRRACAARPAARRASRWLPSTRGTCVRGSAR